MIIDEKDKKILYYLDEDAFQPFSAIAKKTRLSKQVVAYRIEELKRKGILIKTCAIVNLAKLGYEFFKFYIKYEAITKEKETEVLRKLDAHPRVGYMCVCDGRFDLFIGVWATDIHDLYSSYLSCISLLEFSPFLHLLLPFSLYVFYNFLYI